MGQTLEDPVKGRLVQATVDLHVYRGRAERRAAGRARGHTRPPGTLLARQQAAMCVIHSLVCGRSHSTHHACSTKQTVVIIPDNTLNASYIKIGRLFMIGCITALPAIPGHHHAATAADTHRSAGEQSHPGFRPTQTGGGWQGCHGSREGGGSVLPGLPSCQPEHFMGREGGREGGGRTHKGGRAQKVKAGLCTLDTLLTALLVTTKYQ